MGVFLDSAGVFIAVPTPVGLQLKEEPRADVARYDLLLKKLALVALVSVPLLAMTEVTHGAA